MASKLDLWVLPLAIAAMAEHGQGKLFPKAPDPVSHEDIPCAALQMSRSIRHPTEIFSYLD